MIFLGAVLFYPQAVPVENPRGYVTQCLCYGEYRFSFRDVSQGCAVPCTGDPGKYCGSEGTVRVTLQTGEYHALYRGPRRASNVSLRGRLE